MRVSSTRNIVAIQHSPRTDPNAARQRWLIGLAVLLSIVFLWLTFSGIDLGLVGATLAHASPGWIFCAAVMVLATHALKALRWQQIFTRERRPSYGLAFAALSVGWLINTYMPIRIGEVLRAVLSRKAGQDQTAYALGTIAVEKIADTICLAIAFVVLALAMPLPGWLQVPLYLAIIAAAIGLIALVVFFRLRERIIGLVERYAPKRLVWLVNQTHEALQGLDSSARPRILISVALSSLAIWANSALTNSVVFRALDLDLPWYAGLLVLIVVQVGVGSLPTTPPGAIGIFHYLARLSLTLFAVPIAMATTYAVLLHLVVYLPLSFVSIASLWHPATGLSRIRAILPGKQDVAA